MGNPALKPRGPLLLTLLWLPLWLTPAPSLASPLPIVRISEAPNALGGSYTVSIDSTQTDELWYLWAFGVINGHAQEVETDRTGWSAELVQHQDWDDGLSFSQYYPDGTENVHFTTGTDGVGTFDQVFGPMHHQAAMYWASEYYGNALGANATSSQFHWLFGPPNSTAFVMLTSVTGRGFMTCNLETGGNCSGYDAAVVPVPAAVWLFGSALGALLTIARRRRRPGERRRMGH